MQTADNLGSFGGSLVNLGSLFLFSVQVCGTVHLKVASNMIIHIDCFFLNVLKQSKLFKLFTC